MTEEEREKIVKQNRRIFLLQTKFAELSKTLASISEITLETMFEMLQENFEKLYGKDV